MRALASLSETLCSIQSTNSRGTTSWEVVMEQSKQRACKECRGEHRYQAGSHLLSPYANQTKTTLSNAVGRPSRLFFVKQTKVMLLYDGPAISSLDFAQDRSRSSAALLACADGADSCECGIHDVSVPQSVLVIWRIAHSENSKVYTNAPDGWPIHIGVWPVDAVLKDTAPERDGFVVVYVWVNPGSSMEKKFVQTYRTQHGLLSC